MEIKMGYPKIALGLVAGLATTVAAIQLSVAAPVSIGAMAGALALKNSVTSDAVDVRWRGRYGWGAAGFGTGLALGALAARPYYYSPYYYGPPPAYYAPVPVYPEPTYVEPAPDPNGPARQCWVPTDKDRGFGYYRPC
jgi:hypothetical protein